MSNKIDTAVELLLGLLENEGAKGVPLEDIEEDLANRLKDRRDSQELPNASETINYALDNWVVEKTIDDCENEEGVPIGPQIWFLRILTQEESEKLQNLSEAEKTVLRILRNQEDEHRLGTMRRDELLSRLKEAGFSVDNVPGPRSIVSDFYESKNDQMVAWYYLIPQYERSKEYKQAMHDAAMRAFEKEVRNGQ